MYKTIIYSNDLENLKKMYNSIFNNPDNFCINLIKIATTYDELISMHEKLKFNMIIISECDMNVFSLIENIETKIIFSINISNFKNTKNSLYLPFDENSDYTYSKLQKFLSKINEKDIRKKVQKILETFHFDFKLNGTKYLQDAIIYSYKNKDDYIFENLEKNIYPYISKKFKISPENAKWAIIRAINAVNFRYTDIETQFPCYSFDEKLTPKSLITDIVNHL